MFLLFYYAIPDSSISEMSVKILLKSVFDTSINKSAAHKGYGRHFLYFTVLYQNSVSFVLNSFRSFSFTTFPYFSNFFRSMSFGLPMMPMA